MLRLEMNAPKSSEPIVAPATQATSLPAFLRDVQERVGALGEGYEPDRDRLDALRRRLREERCYLAVLGQFKRGKSTLVNALLGEAILPSAVIPLTSVPTFLYGGERIGARVYFENGRPEERFAGSAPDALREFLGQFVTESANPRNRLGVRLVEVTCPAPILRQGMTLIDTPGIGSTFRHNTEATVNFLPQCDAALFVVSADPPITEVEVEFLQLARRKLARLFFVLNKMDYLDDEERRAAVAFLEQVLCEQVGYDTPPPILCASARRGLAARRAGDAAAWTHSGMAAIERQIVDFLVAEKAQVLSRAIWRQAADLLADVQRRLELTATSLQMPLARLDERIGMFEERIGQIQEQSIVVMNRLAADEQRLLDSIRSYCDELIPRSHKFLREIVQTSQNRHGSAWTEDLAREAIAAAIPAFFEREFGALHQRCQAELGDALAPHRRRVEQLIAAVHELVTKLFDVPFEHRPHEIVLVNADQPYWRTHKWRLAELASIPPAWIDRLLPLRLRHARIRRRLAEQLEYLVTRNVGDLQESAMENVKRSVGEFRDALNEGLAQAIQTTRQALEVARRRRVEGSAVAAPDLCRLRTAAVDLETLRRRAAQHGSIASVAD